MSPQQDILNCSFPLWFSQFQGHTIDSIVLKIPKIYVEYLLADGLFLPDKHSSVQEHKSSDILNSGDFWYSHDDGDAMKSQQMFVSDEFVEFQSHVESGIEELGGKVFPKLNWSSPKDASWIAVNRSLCCENFNDICLLLKSSDYVTHDLTNPFMISEHTNNLNSSETPTIEYVLVLRKWLDICPSGEYRCFIRQSQLIAISQRSTQHFIFIQPNKDTIVRKIKRFYKNHIRGNFANSSYVLDLYTPGESGQPIIVDINPFVSITDSLLFTWDELEKVTMPEIAEGSTTRGIVFRSVPSEGFAATDLTCNAFPVDFQHLATGEDPAKLIDLLKLHQRTTSTTSTNSTDSD